MYPVGIPKKLDGGPENAIVPHIGGMNGYGVSPAMFAESHSPLLGYWRVLMKRRLVVIVSAISMLVLSLIVTLRMTPLYEATARIAINREGSDVLRLNEGDTSGSGEDWDYTVALETQARILRSDALALQVIRTLHLDQNPDFAGKNEAAKARAAVAANNPEEVAALERDLVSSFNSSLRVSIVPRTRVVELTYLHPNPKLAAAIVNTLSSVYIEQSFKTRYESAMQASEWLSKQLADLQRKVEKSQEDLVAYQKANEITGLDDKQNITMTKLDELNKELTSAEGDRIQKEARYRQVKSGNPDLISSPLEQGLFEKLRSQEADLMRQSAELKVQYGPNHPKAMENENQLKAVRTAIAAEVFRIGKRLENDYNTSLQREKMLHASLDSQKSEANKLGERAIQYNLLKRDSESNRQLYDTLQSRLKEAAIRAGIRSTNIQIVDAARVPEVPAKPNKPRNVAIGFFFGLMAGIAIAFSLEAIDNTVNTPEQAEMVSGLPQLGMVPLNGIASRGKQKLLGAAPMVAESAALISHQRPRSEAAEAYRAVRTSILLSALGEPPRAIMVTSSMPQEGKTTTSINTALVLAQKGGKVLLVDADMRRPSVQKSLNLRTRHGLSSILSGASTFEQAVVVSAQLSNLHVLTAGPHPPQPSELLGSDVMKRFLASWRETYDHIVIDTPPVLSVTDAVLLSASVDGVLLVCRSAHTTKQALRRSREMLGRVNARVLGVLLNAVDVHGKGGYYNYGYYGYGAKYGSYYSSEETESSAVSSSVE